MLGALNGFRLGVAPIAFIFGGAVGIVTAPLPAMMLARKRLFVALPVVYLPPAAVAYGTSNMLMPWLTIGAFVLTCLIAWLYLPNVRAWRPILDRCRRCRYDLRGLPARVCPECGQDNSVPEAMRNPHPENPYETEARAKR